MADCDISQWAKRPNKENPEILQAFQVSVPVWHMPQLSSAWNWNQISAMPLPCKALHEFNIQMEL